MNLVVKEYRQVTEKPVLLRPKFPKGILLFILICAILGLFAHWKGVDFLVEDEAGNVDISPKRKVQLQKRLERLNQAEQYVLRAEEDGYYPCYSCGVDTMIFLFRTEVWKYGVTSRGEKGRYGDKLKGMYLLYQVQLRGNIEDCLKAEAIKIFKYPTLPENLKRKLPIIRPPGNRVDL